MHLLQALKKDLNPFIIACNDSPRDIDADIADTLKQNASASFDEEYDVVDEDDLLTPNNTVNKKVGQEIIAGRNKPINDNQPSTNLDFVERMMAIQSEISTINMF